MPSPPTEAPVGVTKPHVGRREPRSALQGARLAVNDDGHVPSVVLVGKRHRKPAVHDGRAEVAMAPWPRNHVGRAVATILMRPVGRVHEHDPRNLFAIRRIQPGVHTVVRIDRMEFCVELEAEGVKGGVGQLDVGPGAAVRVLGLQLQVRGGHCALDRRHRLWRLAAQANLVVSRRLAGDEVDLGAGTRQGTFVAGATNGRWPRQVVFEVDNRCCQTAIKRQKKQRRGNEKFDNPVGLPKPGLS